jgi:hypothetical protein
MELSQLSVTYDRENDRILTRFNTQEGHELRVWLTRRLLSRANQPLLDAMVNQDARQSHLLSDDAASKRVVSAFRQSQSLEAADFKTPYNTQAKAYPLGTAPLLVTHLHITAKAQGNLAIRFEEQLGTPPVSRSFQVALGSDMLHSFMHLLQAALKAADWGFDFDDQPAFLGDDPLLHTPGTGYLN